MRRGLTYDDVLLVPKRTPVRSRSEVDTSVDLAGGISLEVPVISAPMDTVTGMEMSQAMADAGGAGIIHRFCSVGEQVDAVKSVDGIVGAAIGISSTELNRRLSKLYDAGIDFLCVDVAHAHMDRAIDVTKQISSVYPGLPLMVGTVATYHGMGDLVDAGADIVRVGVGPGSSCLTREVAGVGVPQLTAIQDASKWGHGSIVADGGIRKPGDIVKALMAGADAVVVGGLLGACEESLAPVFSEDSGDYKEIRGMASYEAQEDYNPEKPAYVEGGTYRVPIDGSVAEKMDSFEKGIRSGVSYCGARTIEEARENAEFIEITPNTVYRNGIHGG